MTQPALDANWRPGAALAAGVFLLGTALSIAGALRLQRDIDSQAQDDFQRSAERVAEDVVRRFRQPVYGLRGAAGMYAASAQVRRDGFRAYVEARDLPREFPGVRGFGFIQRVAREDLADFLAAERGDAAPGFAVRALDDAARADLYVIKFIEPAAINAGALGLDVGSEPRRRAAAEQAVRTGEPTLSAPIVLVQDARRTPGFLLFVPVFRRGADTATPVQRQAALVGLLYAPIVASELLSGGADARAGLVDVALFDTIGGAPAGEPFFDSRTSAGLDAGAPGVVAATAKFASARSLSLPGRQVTLQVRSAPRFEAAHPGGSPWLVFAGGLLASGLLAALLWQQASARRRAESIAQGMTADLARLAQVVRHTSNAVSITDRDLRITWINEGFTRTSGYRAEEALGQTPGALLGSGKADPAALQALAESAATGTGCRVEILNRAKDGREYWIDTEVQPLHDARGRLTGFMEIGTEITARKAAEQALAHERQNLANIIDGTGVGTWEWNVETGQARFNERWAQIIGYRLDELGTLSIQTWTRFAHPEDMTRSAALLERHFSGELSAYECEARMRHRDGHWVWVLDRGKLFSRTDTGRPGWMAGTHMDITERKRIEAALHASQAFLDKAGRIGGVGGWSLELATQTAQWTDQTCRIFDVEPGHQPTLEQTMSHYTAEVQQTIRRAVNHSIRTGESFDLELPCVTARGRPIWVRGTGEAEFVDGQAVRVVGAFQDITARREMAAAMARSNELLASVIESLPCGLTVFDADLGLLLANREVGRLLELPAHLLEAGRTRFDEVVRFGAERGDYGAGDVEQLVEPIVRRARGPIVPHQFERTAGDGRIVEVRGGPLPGGGFVTTYTDITARRQAEAEARRSAELLRGAIDAIDEAFVLYDPDDRLAFCNDKYRQIYRASSEAIVPGATFEDIVRYGAERGQYTDAIGRVDAWVAERMAVHRDSNITLVQRLEDGRSLRILERKMPDGHIVGFRIDITELVRATEAAEQASRAKSQFLANMSHEIRTPMNAILGMLALLRKTDLTPRQADYAGKTEGAARSLLGLLNDILDFSKVEAGRMTLDPHPFRIDQVLRDLSVILSAGVGRKRVEVLFDIDPAVPHHLVGDAMRLQQVLINLGGNAIKFTEHGEVVVSVRVVERDAAAVTLEWAVRDTGIGIAPENQQRIFSGFTQAEASITRRFGGTGLGVAISQRLVALMGGELGLDSVLGQGSRFHFRITLPLAAAAPGDAPAGVAALRALVVDDNPTAREVLARMAGSLGWVVDVADSGASALARLQDQARGGASYQAVFIDWQMPDMDGWETCGRIRELGLNGAAPMVVMVTAHDREALAQRSQAEQSLLDGFLVKPVTASMLLEAVVDARVAHRLPHPSRPTKGSGLRRLTGLRLLVVEDNPNNQQVARELLADEGALVQVAQHGQEAVEAIAVAQPQFDVVLMDLQMPVMDGFTATSRIRQDLGLQTLPIVAMTANALSSDRDACLAAGMNDHVGKPFDLDHLVRVLRRHAGRTPMPDADAPRGEPALPAALAQAAAAAGVDIAAALRRLGGNAAVYRRLLRQFIDDLQGLPDRLRAAPSAGPSLPAAQLLHTLKGLAGTLGASALSAAAAEAERQLGVADVDAAAVIEGACHAIGSAGPGLAALWRAWPPDHPVPAAAPSGGDVQALRAALHPLVEYLRNSDMAALQTMGSLQRDFGGTLGDALAPLDDAVGALEFDRALDLCADLMKRLDE